MKYKQDNLCIILPPCNNYAIVTTAGILLKDQDNMTIGTIGITDNPIREAE